MSQRLRRFAVTYTRKGKSETVTVIATSGIRAIDSVLVARHGLVPPNGFTVQDSVKAFCARHGCTVSARPA